MYKHLLFIMMIATCATLASCSNDDSEEYLSEQESQNTISTKTLDSEMGLQTAAYEAYKNAMKKLCSQTRSGVYLILIFMVEAILIMMGI